MFFSKLAAVSALAFAAFSAAAPTTSSDQVTVILTQLKSNVNEPCTFLAATNANTAQSDIVSHITQLTTHINTACGQVNAMGSAPIEDIPLGALTALLGEIISIVIGALTGLLKCAETIPALLAVVLPLVIAAATALLTLVTAICGKVVGLALIVLVGPVLTLLATATGLLSSLLGGALKCIAGLTTL
ncbi:hypothetical protein MVEN_00467100 [Mycena venus]|uniref:Uncharacterized protein n=1 Tax=Mycena venus TaxID=2733690 RepID=A0A8H7D889_9AGAR|nr:hypothetical protein MVEN_00467100 [Mycena venus]